MATLVKRITDPAFKYVPAAKTDLRKTFARIRREQEEANRNTNVQQLKRKEIK